MGSTVFALSIINILVSIGCFWYAFSKSCRPITWKKFKYSLFCSAANFAAAINGFYFLFTRPVV